MQYDFKLSANGGQRVEVAGRFFKYASGQGAIRVTTSKGGYVDLMPGQGVWGADFSGLTISDRSGLSNSGVLLAGEFDFRDQSIPGVVNVADGSAAKTLLLNCFMGSDVASGGSGTYNVIALANPVGSGKNAIVESVEYTTITGSEFSFLAGLYTAPAPVAAKNKKVGGAASVCSVAAESMATAATLTAMGRPLYTLYAEQGKLRTMKFNEPIILPPGYALLARPGAATNQLGYAHFEFREETA